MSNAELQQDLEAHITSLREVASGVVGPTPDFADAVERARANGSDFEVPELVGRNPEDAALGGELALFVDGARERAALVERRIRRDPPSSDGGRRRGLAIVFGVAACAAAAAVVVFGPFTGMGPAEGPDESLARHQAVRVAIPGSATAGEAVGAMGSQAAKHVAPVLHPALEMGLGWTASERAEKVGAFVHVERLAVETMHLRGKDLDDEIARLDAAARERWRAGDLVGAERLFRDAIRVGGRRAAVDVIYGDVILLARQLRGPGAQTKAWRQYLRRFPDGRFADDARAGLCRRAEPAQDCWLDYLRRHPEGAHRDEAARAASK